MKSNGFVLAGSCSVFGDTLYSLSAGFCRVGWPQKILQKELLSGMFRILVTPCGRVQYGTQLPFSKLVYICHIVFGDRAALGGITDRDSHLPFFFLVFAFAGVF